LEKRGACGEAETRFVEKSATCGIREVFKYTIDPAVSLFGQLF